MNALTPEGKKARAVEMLGETGARVAFCAASTTGRDGLFLADGGGTRPLSVPFGGHCRTPALSPDGRFAIFSQDNGHGAALCVTEIETGRSEALAVSSQTDYAPAWSGDGTWLAWCRCPAMILGRADEAEIWASPWPDFRPRRLTANSRMDCYPVFASDGEEVIFESGRTDGLFGLFAVTLEGTEYPILYEPGVSGNGIPHLVGDRLVFERAMAETPALYDVYSIGRDKPTSLTRHTFFGRHVNPTPRYSPDGILIAYHMPEGEDCLVHLINSIQPETPPMFLANAGSWLCYPRFDRTGKLIACQDYRRECLWIADVKTGETAQLRGSGPYRVTRFLELYNHDIA